MFDFFIKICNFFIFPSFYIIFIFLLTLYFFYVIHAISMSIEKFNNFISKYLMVLLLFMTGALFFINEKFSAYTHKNIFKADSICCFQQQNIETNSFSSRKDCVIKKIKSSICSMVFQSSAVFSCCKINFKKTIYSFVRISPITSKLAVNTLFYIRAP